MHTKLILIVEDNEELLCSLERHLSEHGFRTISASDGFKGFKRFRRRSPIWSFSTTGRHALTAISYWKKFDISAIRRSLWRQLGTRTMTSCGAVT
ncbi:CheY-like chemotaxis protein [Sinorhizobium meliloti]